MRAAALTYAFARSNFIIMLTHRVRYVIGVFNYLVYAAVQWYLWGAVFYGEPKIATWTLEQTQTYVCLIQVVRSTYFSNADSQLAGRISKGEIASDLLRPTALLLQFYGSALGELLFRAFFMGLPVGLLLWACFGLLAPASLGAALAFAFSVVLAFHIFFALNFLTGLLAVFTEKLQGFLWAKFILLQFLSGQLLPLEFFKPYPTVYAAFDALPFKGLAHTPLSIYLGRWEPAQVHFELLLQCAWTAALLVLCECSWRVVRRRLCLLGG